MTIDSTGNVGIGTTPEKLLHVYESSSNVTANASTSVFIEKSGINYLGGKMTNDELCNH